MQIEHATEAEVAGVVALIRAIYHEYGFRFESAEQELPSLFAFAEYYAEPRGAFFVMREDGTICGSVGVVRESADAAELRHLYLTPGLRGRRIGRALVETVLRWCHQRGIRRVLLWSDEHFDRAHALYERMGFIRTGQRIESGVNQNREYRYELDLGQQR